MPYLNKIVIYPIKSLDGVSVDQATILSGGPLQHDREFAIVDEHHQVVNGKRTAKIHGIRSTFDLAARTITVRTEGTTDAASFHLDHDRPLLNQWFSQYFGFPVRLIQDSQAGFPDDTLSPGPTIVSTPTLELLTSWLPELSLEELRRRFRTNLEVTDVEPFWEDQLFGAIDTTVPFQIGDVQLEGVNPCQRCVVPTRNTLTGEPTSGFQKTLAAKRQETLPNWTDRSHFNHFFRLAVNTRPASAQTGKTLQVGNPVIL